MLKREELHGCSAASRRTLTALVCECLMMAKGLKTDIWLFLGFIIRTKNSFLHEQHLQQCCVGRAVVQPTTLPVWWETITGRTVQWEDTQDLQESCDCVSAWAGLSGLWITRQCSWGGSYGVTCMRKCEATYGADFLSWSFQLYERYWRSMKQAKWEKFILPPFPMDQTDSREHIFI